MRSITRFTILVGLLLLMVSGIFAQQAVIKEISGTVELQKAGTTVWVKAVQGQTITGNTTISTGFKSSALITIGNSVLTVRPLTRLTLTEIAAAAGTETINVNIQAGGLRADVTPPAGGRGSYSVQSPIATASVRGTVFEITTHTLSVIKGAVEFRSASGVYVIVEAGGTSAIDERTGRPTLPGGTLLAALDPELPIGSGVINSFDGAAQRINSFDVVGVIDYR